MGDVKVEHHAHHHYVQAVQTPPPPAAYLLQVRRIAPTELVGREAELAVLTEFSTSADGPAYLWWRAPAWAGKSALLSWFVLHPPAGVRVVSFFITARFAGQSDRTAFTEALAEQLAGILGEQPPPLTTTNRDYAVLTLLDRASAACADCGEQLVLVVDGIDEDRGVSGPDAYSIASVLPARPPAGLRVVLAGRPHPPVPGDVPPEHPLHDPGIVRPLRPSSRAAVVRRDMLRELGELLGGNPVERDLLGVLTAAGGGLTARDLGELVCRPAWEVSERIASVAGRSFGLRRSVWRPGEWPDVYVLGHEELQTTAAERFGEADLQAYRQRLHRWADGYRAREWPAHSPEYLLRGYFRLVRGAGDLDRMFACAVDSARHDRMLDLSGGDAAALEEVNTTLHALAAGTPPDLAALGRLSVHQAALSGRNWNMPEDLPGLWCALGRVNRAEALSWAMPLHARGTALSAVAQHIAKAGDSDRATALARQCETATHFPIGDRWPALAAAARAYAAAGDMSRALHMAQQAEEAAHRIRWATVKIVGVMAYVGALERAEAVISALDDSEARMGALTEQALSLVALGDLPRARTAVERAVDLVPKFGGVMDKAWLLITLAQAQAAVGDSVSAVARAESAEALARSHDPFQRTTVLAGVARVLAAAGNAARADELTGLAKQSALEVGDPPNRATALTRVARAMADAGLTDRARATAEEAEATARSPEPLSQAESLACLAVGLVAAGAPDRALPVAHRAESLLLQASTGSTGSSSEYSRAQKNVVVALARAGDIERANTFAATIRAADDQALALAGIAAALAGSGRREEADAYIARAYAYSSRRSGRHPDLETWRLSELAGALATAGGLECALDIGNGLVPFLRADIMATVARILADAGDTGRARALAEEAAAIMDPGTDRHDHDWVRADIALAMASAGWTDRAEALGGSLTDRRARGRGLTGVATALARAGLTGRAGKLADAMDDLARSMTEIERPEELLCDLAMGVQPEHAHQRLARALLSGGWRTCLEALAYVDPASVHAIATELLARLDRHPAR
ncbi:hypothetical protein [Streptomyces venezuelae]|uniref:hypothetical protein n=1 Tax=Streptomyces venezuelae TaxID=54571 RepID=UPI0033201191